MALGHAHSQAASRPLHECTLPLQEMFVALGRQMDRELDDIAPMLLKKAGEISNAGKLA